MLCRLPSEKVSVYVRMGGVILLDVVVKREGASLIDYAVRAIDDDFFFLACHDALLFFQRIQRDAQHVARLQEHIMSIAEAVFLDDVKNHLIEVVAVLLGKMLYGKVVHGATVANGGRGVIAYIAAIVIQMPAVADAGANQSHNND